MEGEYVYETVHHPGQLTPPQIGKVQNLFQVIATVEVGGDSGKEFVVFPLGARNSRFDNRFPILLLEPQNSRPSFVLSFNSTKVSEIFTPTLLHIFAKLKA